jgi:hypothetical protein
MSEITNFLICILIAIIGWYTNRITVKIDELVKTIQDMLITNMAVEKDIETIKDNVDDHEKRITKLETK